MKKYLSKQNRALLSELVRTDFKLRYQGSVLGYTWSLLKPLFLFAILYVVFGQILRFGAGIPNYPVYLLLGIVLWSFFGEATKQGATSIVSRGSLLRKIKFPKYIIVISATISALINLALSLIVVGVFVIISGAEVQPIALILLPLLILQLYIFSLAIAFFLAAINVRFRDITHIWDIVVQAGFYATPIIYPITMIMASSTLLAELMLLLNPVAQIIQDARYLLVTPNSTTLHELMGGFIMYLIPIAVVGAVSLLAAYFFKKRSKTFTEDL